MNNDSAMTEKNQLIFKKADMDVMIKIMLIWLFLALKRLFSFSSRNLGFQGVIKMHQQEVPLVARAVSDS